MRELDISHSWDVSDSERLAYTLAHHAVRRASDSASEPPSQGLSLLGRGKNCEPCRDHLLFSVLLTDNCTKAIEYFLGNAKGGEIVNCHRQRAAAAKPFDQFEWLIAHWLSFQERGYIKLTVEIIWCSRVVTNRWRHAENNRVTWLTTRRSMA